MLRFVRNAILLWILLVHIACIFTYYRIVVKNEKNSVHRKNNEFHESEIDFQLNDDRPSTEFLLATSTEPYSHPNFTTSQSVTERAMKTFDGIYVRDAYRVSDTEIRVVYLAKSENRTPLRALINDEWKEFEWFCSNYTTCIDYGFCSIAPRIGQLQINSKNLHNESYLNIASSASEEYFKIPLRDVRPNPQESQNYNHILGVCLQPIFFLTDWTIVIQFFESWLSQGATKFYIYVHSYSKQTKNVLQFYEEQLGNGLELIDWSDLPVPARDRGIYDRDPNAHVFRHGATAFMHDCMLRARHSVKFIANSDLDDLPVSKNRNVAKDMEEIALRHPDAGQFILDWYLTEQKQDWDNINTPADVNFQLNNAKVLLLEHVRFDYSIAKKIVHRPERVVHFDQHNVFGNEKMGDGLRHYTAVEMFGNPSLYFSHLRRFERLVVDPAPPLAHNVSFDYLTLKKLNAKMSHSYLKRIEGTEFKNLTMSPWTIEARETMRNLEQCRLEAFGTILSDENEMCRQSSAGCAGMLMADVQFVKAPMSWTNIAHKAKFNSYTRRLKRN